MPPETAVRRYAQSIAVALTGATSVAWYPLEGSLYSARYAATLLAAAMWIVLWCVGLLEPRWRELRGVYSAAGAVVFAVLFASALSGWPGAALTWGNQTLVSAPVWVAWVICFVGVSSVEPSRESRWGLSAVAALGALAIGSLTTRLGLPLATPWANSNYVGPVTLVLAGLALALGASASTRRGALGWRGYALVLLVLAVSSGSLAAVIGTGGFALLVIAMRPQLVGLALSRRQGFALSVTVAAAALVLVAGVSGVKWGDPTYLVRDELTSRNGVARIEMWEAALRVTGARPILGAGPDSFALAGQRAFSPTVFRVMWAPDAQFAMPATPHSLPLEVLASFGVIGLLAFAWLGVAWALAAFRAHDAGSSGVSFRAACGIGVLAWAIAMLFLPVALVTGSLVAVAAGAALWGRSAESGGRRRPARRLVLRWLAGVPLVAVAVWLSVAMVGGRVVFMRAAASSGASAVADILATATRWQPTLGVLRYRELEATGYQLDAESVKDFQREVDASNPEVLGYAPYVVSLTAESLSEAATSSRTNLKWERAMLERAERAAPHYPAVDMLRAWLAALEGDTAEARKLLETQRQFADLYPQFGLIEEQIRLREQGGAQ